MNIGLMLLCCFIAYVIPWPMLLAAYAILGPAHYLTQISWLHHRKYFVLRSYDTIILEFPLDALVIKNLGIAMKPRSD